MENTSRAADQLRRIEETADRDQWLNRIHPLVKLFITLYYIFLVVSFHKYDLSGLLSMALYLIVLYTLGDISFSESLKRLRFVLPLVCITGILNPFFDRQPAASIGGWTVTGGMASMASLTAKGVFTVLGAYLLIASTSIQKICAALRMIRVPKLLVTVILLIYRYLVLLLEEASQISQAYALRAPKQKGIKFQAWGPLAGQLLLRSADRAQNVYDSMSLRGFTGEFYYGAGLRLSGKDLVYFLIWTALLTALRAVPLFETAGRLFFMA